ncbi:MAG: MFS transporter [Deltaproteobacteria bacterium]|nr:MFS transporter [Deltaproteobacteria bacterium]
MKRYALITSASASFLTPFMGSAVNLAIPSIGRSLNGSAVMLSWVVSSFLLTTAALLLPIGRLADIFGRKKIFLLGIFIFSLFSALCSFAWSLNSLIVFRVLQAAGGAMIFGTSIAILTSVYPPQERGTALGIVVASTYTGLSLGPVLGGVLNHQIGWESIFYFGAFLGLLTFLFAVTRLKGEWADARGEYFDLPGAVIYMAGIAATIFGFSSIAAFFQAKYILGAGLILLMIFVRHEAKMPQPLMNVRLFSGNVTFTLSNLAALINYSATFAVGFLLSVYLQIVRGFDSQIAGLILLSQPVLMASLSPFAGRLSDRLEPRIVSSWGMGFTTLGLLAFVFIAESTSVWKIVLALILIGVGFALFSSPNTNAVMGSVKKKFYGVASSTLGTMRLLGQAISMAISTLIIHLYLGDVKLSLAPQYPLEKSISTSFAVFAIICFVGVFASLARGNINAGE